MLMLKACSPKVNQEAIVYPCRSQIIHELCFMASIERRYGFEFNDYHVFNDYVRSVIPDTNILVSDFYCNFLFRFDA